LPSENELLAQIQTTREQHHAQQLADWQTAVSQWEQNGKEGKKPSKSKASTQAVKFEENFADLPRGWGVVKLENIAEINSGMSVSANRKLTNPIAVNYLRVGNVQRGYLDLEEIKEMKIEAESFNKYRLRFGDVLFNEGGDRDKLGRGWIWENQVENCITQNHVFRASPFLKSITHSKYISYLGNSRYGKSYFEETGKQTTNLASINKTVLSNFPVKLPSLAEQTQIVAILESKLTACDQLADELAKQLKQAEMLKQAVLKAAFSGGLLDK
jgi:type I restriction enzyme stySPI specificity protein